MKLSVLRVVALTCVVFLAGCAADSLHREGVRAFEHGDYETGIAKLSEATQRDPNNLIYRMDLLSRKERSVQTLLAQADSARASGDSGTVEKTYRRILAIDPSNPRAKTGLAQVAADISHTERVTRAQKLFDRKDLDGAEIELRAVLEEDAGFVPAQTLLAKLQSTRGPVSAVPVLKTKDSRAVTLQFRDAQTKMVFEVLARQTGLNFIFDKDVKSDGKTTIFVSGVPVESAIDLILAQNQLAKQILADNMVLIYPATPTKQKEYQEEIVHSFYLANAAVKDVESLLKTVLGAKTLFVDERANLVVMRDTPEHIRMAEKLVSSIDVAEPEVILEVEVLEAANTLLDQLGIRYPSAATFTPTPLASTSTTGTTVTTSSGSSMLIADYLGQNKNTIQVSQLSAGVDLLKTTGQTNVLSSPRIRAKNKEKAKIMIGDRVPVVTSGASATSGGTYSTSSVQYLEVGLNLDVTPTIHLDGNVQIKMGLEVSSIVKEFDVATGSGGQTHVYQIGTRNATTTLELKDGETQILAGLITDSDQKSSSHIPGLGDMPILGRLFGSDGTNRSKSEIILSITPHIIRAQTRPTVDATEFWYGTEAQTRSAPFSNLHSPDAPAVPTANNAASAAASGGVSMMTSSVAMPMNNNVPRAVPQRIDAAVGSPPASSAANADGAAGGSDPGKATEPTAKESTPAKEAAPAKDPATGDGKARVTLEGPTSAKVGDEITVSVHMEGATGVGKARTQLRFDPTALQVVSADAGDVAPDGHVDVRAGGIQMDSSGTQVGASGSLLNARFKVMLARPTVTVSTQVVLVGDDGGALAATQATPLSIATAP